MDVNKPVNITGKLTATSINLENTDLASGAADAINKMVNVTSTADELNILSGVSVTSTEVDLLSGAEAGKVKNGKTAVYSSSGELKATYQLQLYQQTHQLLLEMSASAMVLISDSGGAAPFSDNNLTTTGNITGNNVIVNGNLTVNGSTHCIQ